MSEWEDKIKKELLLIDRGLPPPLPITASGAHCPWCGELHETVTIGGGNECDVCHRHFIVSFPDWAEDDQLYSWTTFSWADHQLLRERPDLLPTFEPNDRLKNIYFELRVTDLGIRGTA